MIIDCHGHHTTAPAAHASWREGQQAAFRVGEQPPPYSKIFDGRPQISLPQHERIIAAIRDRDPKASEAAMREHIASVIEALRSTDALRLPS